MRGSLGGRRCWRGVNSWSRRGWRVGLRLEPRDWSDGVDALTGVRARLGLLEKDVMEEDSWGLSTRVSPVAGGGAVTGDSAVAGLRRGISVSIEADATGPSLGVVLAEVSLLGFLGGGGGSSLADPGENLLGDSGDAAGETGLVKVVTTGARDSPFRYSGVGGRLEGGAAADLVREDEDSLLWTGLMAALLLEARASSLAGQTLQPGRPPTDGGFRSLAGWDCEGSSWTAVAGRWVDVVDVDMIETALETVEPWL